ncbi:MULTISPECIES: hypothetical protein [unclassified Nostoc]|uniref:hypothetical protein n=1 Tax=unclassified Nostoc TaxID=2593658 RepID=UPI002AD7D00F|nr:hypothetical protein [Nostoc sp. DedQUE02]
MLAQQADQKNRAIAAPWKVCDRWLVCAWLQADGRVFAGGEGVKFTTKHLTISKLLDGVKNYNYLSPGWENVEVIADVAIASLVQLYNLVPGF